MKCLSGNRPYPRIPQDVSPGNLGLEKAAVVRTTCITNAATAAYSLPGPSHSPYASRPLSHLTGWKWGQMLWKWFVPLFYVYYNRPKWKHFWSSTIWAKMPKLKCIKDGVDQTAAVDWPCTNKPGQWSQWAIHVCKDWDALLSHTWAADLVHDNTWLTFVRYSHSIAAF